MKKCIIAATLIALTAEVQAGVTTYADSSDWNSATTGAVTTVIPDPTSPSGYDIIGFSPASVTYNGVTFSTANGSEYLSDVGPVFSGNPPVLAAYGPVIDTVAPEAVLITFPSAVTAFSLDYGTFDGSNVTFTLGNGDSFTQGSSGGFYTTPDFAGATDTTPFSTVLLTSEDVVLDMNNISYATGSFQNSRPTASTCFWLFPLALQMIKIARQRNQVTAAFQS